jgi:hypothetical protein
LRKTSISIDFFFLSLLLQWPITNKVSNLDREVQREFQREFHSSNVVSLFVLLTHHLAPARPPRIAGDWTDDRTPADEPFFPSINGVDNAVHRSAQPSTIAGRTVRGHVYHEPITYGNRRTEVVAFLNSKDPNPPPATRMANKILPNVQATMANVLVAIIEIFRYLAIAYIPKMILNNKVLCCQRSRPAAHVSSAKINLCAQLIKVMTFGVNATFPTLSTASFWEMAVDQTSLDFVAFACEFVATRLRSANYCMLASVVQLQQSNWDNFKKTIYRRTPFGIWSIAYAEHRNTNGSVKRQDVKITKGIFLPVAIYCTKMIDGFGDRLEGKAHFALEEEYNDDRWNTLVGDPLYPDGDDDDEDGDDDGGDGGDGDDEV